MALIVLKSDVLFLVIQYRWVASTMVTAVRLCCPFPNICTVFTPLKRKHVKKEKKNIPTCPSQNIPFVIFPINRLKRIG